MFLYFPQYYICDYKCTLVKLQAIMQPRVRQRARSEPTKNGPSWNRLGACKYFVGKGKCLKENKIVESKGNIANPNRYKFRLGLWV